MQYSPPPASSPRRLTSLTSGQIPKDTIEIGHSPLPTPAPSPDRPKYTSPHTPVISAAKRLAGLEIPGVAFAATRSPQPMIESRTDIPVLPPTPDDSPVTPSSSLIPSQMLDQLRTFFMRRTTAAATTFDNKLCLKGFTAAMFEQLNEGAIELGLPEWYDGVRYVFFYFRSVLASNLFSQARVFRRSTCGSLPKCYA